MHVPGLSVIPPKFSHVRSLLHDLHWLPVRQRIKMKIKSFTYKMIHGIVPTYLSEVLTLELPTQSVLMIPCSSFSNHVTQILQHVTVPLLVIHPNSGKVSRKLGWYFLGNILY